MQADDKQYYHHCKSIYPKYSLRDFSTQDTAEANAAKYQFAEIKQQFSGILFESLKFRLNWCIDNPWNDASLS